MSAESAAARGTPRHEPDALDRLGARLADWVNPIVVKELRQHLRTRTFWVFFSLMLVCCFLISLVALVAANDHEQVGKVSFVAFFVALSAVQHFVIPYTAYRSMAREQEDETWVLLSLTGLGPRRILSGKVMSFSLQGVLYASAAAPFLLFSYYLNGIDLPSIATAIVLGGLFHLFLVAVSVSLATLAETRLVRGLLHFVVLGLLGVGITAGLSLNVALIETIQRKSANPMFWFGIGGAAFFLCTTALLMFEAAASRLSLATEPYALGPRLLFVVQALGGLALFLGAWLVDGDDDILLVATISFALHMAFVGLFVASDRDSMAKNHWARRSRWSLLAPGGLRGFTLVLLVIVMGSAALVGSAAHDSQADQKLLNVMLAAPCYVLLYLSASVVVARWIPHAPWQTPAIVRLVALGLVIAGTGVPPLIGSMMGEPGDPVLNLLNPIVGLVNVSRDRSDAIAQIALVAAVSLATTVAALTTLARRDVRWT